MSFQEQFQQQLQQQQQQQYQQVESIEANKGYTFEEQFKQLYELKNDDPKRKEFLDDLFQFMADRNQPVNRIPIMAKQVLDLYELYNLVVARGGLVEVINKKIWREITKGLNLPSSITSAAFTLRTQYMKYLYPYECAKNNFSHQEELQQAIDGNRREGRRAGASGGVGGQGGVGVYNGSPYHHSLNGSSGVVGGLNGLGDQQQLGSGAGQYSASPSPNAHLFAGHNLLAAAAAAQQAAAAAVAAQQQQQQSNHHLHQHQHHQQQQPLQLLNNNNSNNQNNNNNNMNSNSNNNTNNNTHPNQLHQAQQQQRPQSTASRSSSISDTSAISTVASPRGANGTTGSLQLGGFHQRLYQDSIDSDHEVDDEGSIDLSHSSKRNSPSIEHDHHQHLTDPHNNHRHLNQQQANSTNVSEQQQQQMAAAAAALRQQLGAALNFAPGANFLSQLASQQQQQQQQQSLGGQQHNNATATNQTSTNSTADTNQLGNIDILKQQQEQVLAALMSGANQQQPQPPSQTRPNSDQQASARAALSMMGSNALILPAPSAHDAMAVAATAQAIGVKGAFIILLL